MQFFCNELLQAERKMRNLALMEVKGRVAESLLNLKTQFGVTSEGCINIQISRLDLASYTGTTYETLFRTMDGFIKEKIIKVNGRKIFILKEAKLEKLIVPK